MSQSNMNTLFEDVAQFNGRFGLPMARCAVVGPRPGADVRTPALLSPEDYEYRLRFIQEELSELCQSHAAGDLPGCADAIVDLVYVVLGTAHYMGIPFDNLWDMVHLANMRKERPAENPGHPRGPREHLRKPEGWEPPDIVGTLIDGGWTP